MANTWYPASIGCRTLAMPMITDTRELAAFCERIADAPYITVDTEFMRENTYWPILCLVQVAAADEARVIDAMADGIDLRPLLDIMDDSNILKVFHAARQDLEIFYNLMGHVPEPVFDTQVAAMVCGFGDQVGYETLIAKLTGARVDKGSRFTDWAMRPLRESQIEYALSDVTHLRKAYEKLQRKLSGTGREQWLAEEMAILTSPETYNPDPAKVYLRIKARSSSPRFLAVLREVAAWREGEARRRNTTRNRVIRDEQLSEIAHHPPKNAADLSRVRGLGRKLAHGESGEGILEAVKRGLEMPAADCPSPPPKSEIPRGLGPVIDLLKVLLKIKCEQNDVAQKLMASNSDLEKIAAFGSDAKVRALSGWRNHMFGEDALKLMRGETAITLKGRKIKLIETSSESSPE